jgi:hypothetical protein
VTRLRKVMLEELQRRNFSSEPGFEWCPTFPPNGNRVAFQWNTGGGNSHIYIKQVGSGDPVRLTSGSRAKFAPAYA